MSWAQLAPFVLLGLAGSLHCAGMCGPLALSLGLSRSRSSLAIAMSYVVGKAAMYSVLALFIARVTLKLDARQPQWMSRSRAVLALIAGAVMVLVACTSLGWIHFEGRARFAPFERALREALHGTRELPGVLRGFALGAANGLLPCGLSWSAIALGGASGLALAAVGPFSFGLATGPVLIGIALGGSALSTSWRARAHRLAAVGLLVYGTWTIARGAQPFAPESTAKVLPECCTQEGATPHRHPNSPELDVKNEAAIER